MRRTNLTRAEQITNAYAQNDLDLAHRLEIDSSSTIIRRAINSFYVKDPLPTSRPIQAEQVYPSYETFEKGLPKVMGLEE